MWSKWSLGLTGQESTRFDFTIYVLATMILATASCLLTLTTRTTFPGSLEIMNVDEDLSLPTARGKCSPSPATSKAKGSDAPPVSYYSAAGSGVAEVKVILSGFVLHVRIGLLVHHRGAELTGESKGISWVQNSCNQGAWTDFECLLGLERGKRRVGVPFDK